MWEGSIYAVARSIDGFLIEEGICLRLTASGCMANVIASSRDPRGVTAAPLNAFTEAKSCGSDGRQGVKVAEDDGGKMEI